MATIITEECINCGACEPECPNTAIYQGGVEWELDGAKHAALSDAIFYIVPEKCTECVGFYDHEACAAVCPVDCCIPDPKRPESEAVLLERAKKLHPDREFAADFPSRFKKEGVAAAPAAAAAPAEAAAAVAAPAPAAAPAPKAAAAPGPSRAAAGRVEKAGAPPPARATEPRKPKTFAGELPGDFDSVMTESLSGGGGRFGLAVRLFVALLQPALGALPHGTKQALEVAIGDRRFFSNAAATGLNLLLNVLLYPSLLVLVAWLRLDTEVFSQQMNWHIFLGTMLASAESVWRLRDGVFGARPIDQMRLGPALYGLPLAALVAPIAMRAARRRQEVRGVGFDGFHGGSFDEKIERDRRYGDVYRFEDLGGVYRLRLEFPRAMPASGLKEELGLPDTMPDYDYDVALHDGALVVRGRVVDPKVRKLTAVASAFPSEFTTQIELGTAVRGFKHRYQDKVLEIILPKKV